MHKWKLTGGLAAAMIISLFAIAGCMNKEPPVQDTANNKAIAKKEGLANGSPEVKTSKPPFDPSK